jgi:hypothetical protein
MAKPLFTRVSHNLKAKGTTPMPSAQQIEANRQNSQSSTGPITEEGKQISSLNATRHGFTGQSLMLSPEEKAPYEAHVQAFLAHYGPANALETNLAQQLADAHWSLHQIFVQQSNLFSLMSATTVQLAAANDAVATAAALQPLTRSLNTLGIYEQRRRRIAAALEVQLKAAIEAREEAEQRRLTEAAKLYMTFKAKGETFIPADFGFDCSLAQVIDFVEGQSLAAEFQNFQKPRG